MSPFSVRLWQQFLVQDWEELMQRLRDVPADYAESGALAISSISGDLINATIALGSAIRDQVAPLVPVFVEALASLLREGETQPVSFARLGVIDCIGIAGSVGAPVPPQVFASARAALSMIETVGGDTIPLYHWHRGLAALALDAPEVYRNIAGLGLHQQVSFVADRRFGPSIQEFIAYLVGAVENGAPVADCMPAWHDRLGNYRDSRKEDTFYAPCLFWTAWVLQHRIAGQPRESVADWLHASLYRAAGVEP